MDGIMLTDISGCVQFVNDSWARMHGYAADGLIGKNFREFFIESQFKNDVEPFLPKLDEESTCQGEVRHISKDGTFFDTWTTSTSMKDAVGNIVGILWTARKIAVRDEAEQLYEKLAKSSYTSIYIVQDRRVKFLNHVGETFGELSAEEIIGLEDSLSFVHPDDREMVRENAIEMLKGKRTSPYEFRCTGRDGNVRWLLETVTSISYQGRRAFLGNAMDITELKEARNKIEEFKDLSSSILDAAPHATFGLEDRRIIFANGAVESVFGWKPEELIGRSTRMLYPTEEEFEEIGRRGYSTLETQRSFVATEFPCRHKDGKIIICRINAARIGKSLKSGKIVVTYEDITEQKKAEEALRERKKQLEIQTRNLEEINTTLNVLLKKREDDKKVLEENILSNVKELIMPCVEMIRKDKMDYKTRVCVDTIESNLNDITSPFLRTLSSKYLKLTPKEILIAGLLKDGKATKEIAELLNASIRGIEFHRENIRMKLGLKNKKENLRSYLMAMSSDD